MLDVQVWVRSTYDGDGDVIAIMLMLAGISMSDLNHHCFVSTSTRGGEGRENETTATHDDRVEIEPLCLITFVPNVDDEPLGWNEDVLPTHHARREHGRGHGCGCTAGMRFHGMVDQACPVGMVSARTR